MAHLGVLMGILLAACSSQKDGGRDAGDETMDAGRPPDARPSSETGPLPDTGVEVDAGPTADAGCGMGFAVRGLPPNVLIVMPRSCYMLYPWDASSGSLFEPTDPRSVWAKAVDGIHQFIERYPGRIRWGLLLYPEGPSEGAAPRCSVPSIAVEPQDGGGAMVLEILDRADTPLSRTHCTTDTNEFRMGPPMTAALQRARESTALHEADRNNFVLLLSAANDHCYRADMIVCDGVNAAAAALLADGIESIALSPSQNTPTEMGCVADSGGFPLPEPGTAFPGTHFYSLPYADTVEHLVTAITEETFSCTFLLDERPPDGGELYLFADDTMVTRDEGHADGWDYDAAANSVTLYGPACDRVRAGEVMRLNVTYGCPMPRCTPTAEVCDGLDNDCNGMVDDDPGCELI